MARVKYHGLIPVLFHDLNRGPVQPEEEFDVPDDEKERYTRRPDIEDLEPDPEPEAEPANEPVTEAEARVEEAPSDTESQPAEPQPAETTAAPADAAPPTE